MATMDLDMPRVSSFCSVPEATLDTLLTSPTADLVQTLLRNIALRAREYDETSSVKTKLEVELESAVRTSASKTRTLKSAVDKGLKEAADLRQKLQAEENSRATLESELQNLKSSSSTSASEVTTLRDRITSLESSSRDTLSLLETTSTAYDSLSSELSAKHQKTIELRQEISKLEQSLRSADNVSSSAKYREQSLQQEIETLKRNNDWLDQELKTKSSEHSKFRKEKGMRISQLQRENEDLASEREALQRTEITLRSHVEEVNQKAETYLSQIQNLKEDAAGQEESFRVQLDAANRLTELMQSSVQTEKRRQQELQDELEKSNAEASQEIGRINAEIETEHQDREAAERRIAELEVQVERLEGDLAVRQNSDSGVSTPRPKLNGHAFETPGRAGSPSLSFSPPSSRFKGGLNFTQLYSEYNNTKTDLENEKRRNEKLASTIDDLIQDLEVHRPEIEELRTEHARLESEVLEMSTLVDNVGKDRDQARRDVRKWEGQVGGLTKEGELLRQQLRDLSSQVKVLLMEVNAHNQGMGSFNEEERARLEQMVRGETEAENLQGATDTDIFISQQLTTFKNVAELQEQNSKLLRLTRQLGDQMEGEEARKEKSQAAQNQEELESLRQKYDRCRDEIKSLVTQSQSYIKERDMFRRMLAHRGQLPGGSDLVSLSGDSIYGQAAEQNRLLKSVEQSPASRDGTSYLAMLKELQDHFDAYRQEAAVDRSSLKEQVDSLAKTNGELRGDTARSKAQAINTSERYEILQGNYNLVKAQNSELQKKSQSLAESAAKHEAKTQQVAEDLVEYKGLLDSIRRETATLKAEKEFWKTVEKRLTEDNQSLLADKTQLNILNANLQNLLNEREHFDSDNRRRVQMQVQALEAELQTTKRKLDEETEANKRASLHKEFDQQQSQTRIDDLTTKLGMVREEFVAAETSRNYLQARVDEMSIELRSAEERVQVLLSKPANQASDHHDTHSQDDHSNNDNQSSDRERESAMEISELKRDRELARSQLESAKNQVEQYKAISQSSEEELQSLNETQDQYRQEMDNIVEEKNEKVREVESRIEDIKSEMSAMNSELSSLRVDKTDNDRRFDEQKASFEAEIIQWKDENERITSKAQFHLEDLKTQAEIAQQAQQNYENELVKHAEAAKALQKVRGEYNQLKLETTELKTEAESAKTSLTQGEESWTEAKDRYERELQALKARRDDMEAQNKLLYQQLDSVSSQISTLQQKRSSTIGEDDSEISASSDLGNLQEIIIYLRREKEIVDRQFELSSHDAKRLRQQLDYTQSQLDEARLKLNQQRQIEEDRERNALNYNKLMETLNELNIHRESNVTLRHETRQAQASLAEKAKQVEELIAQIQPLQAQVRELQDNKELQENELRIMGEDRDRYQQRIQNILQKYDRIDPAELEGLKEQIATLEQEREETLASKQSMQEQIDGIPGRVKLAEDQASERIQELRQKLTDQFKTRSKELSGRIRERDVALQSTVDEKSALEEQIKTLNEELEAVKSERDKVIENSASAQAREPEDGARNGSEDGQVDEVNASGPAQSNRQPLQELADSANQRADEEASKSNGLQHEVQAANSRIAELESQIAELQRGLDISNAQVVELQSQSQPTQQQLDTDDSANLRSQLDKLKQDLIEAEKERESLKAGEPNKVSSSSFQNGEGSSSIDTIRAEFEARHNEQIKQSEEKLKQRTEAMKSQLQKKLTEGKEQNAKALENLKTEHNAEIETLMTRHQEEVDELKRNEDRRFEEFKKARLSEQNSQVNGDQAIKVEPKVQDSQGNWEPTEDQIKALIANNPTVKGIVSRNIHTQLNKQKEAITNNIREEQQKLLAEKLAEADKKAISTKEQAVTMEGQKSKVKISMAENKMRSAHAKLDVVQKAASETPQKPVSEVWDIAKDAKPPQIFGLPSASQSSPQVAALSKLNPPQPQSIAQPSKSSAPVSNGSQQRATSTVLQNQPVPQSPNPTSSSAQSPQSQQQVTPVDTQQPPQTDHSQPSSGNQAQTARLPNKPLQPQSSQRGGAGTGPAALRSLQQQSGLPIPSGPSGLSQGNASQRGGRGRGRGSIPRGGGTQPVQTSAPSHPSQPNQGSPTTPRGSTFNAGARQFVPQGNKRAREDGQESGQEGNGGKRIRGGGRGAGEAGS